MEENTCTSRRKVDGNLRVMILTVSGVYPSQTGSCLTYLV